MRWKNLKILGGCWLMICAGVGHVLGDFATDLARVSIEAAGGQAAHAALRGLRATGVTRVGEVEVRFVLHAERPNRLHIETLGEKGSLVRAFDGERAPWLQAGAKASLRRLEAADEGDFIREADFDSLLYDHQRRNISLDYAGEAKIDGRPMQKLLATVNFSETVTLFIDEETHLLARRESIRKVHGKDLRVRTDFSDYQSCRGVLFPRRIRTSIGERVLSDTSITGLEANPRLPPGFFAPPKADWPSLK